MPSADLRGRTPDAAPVFAALGDPTRLALVARLSASGPLSISALAEGGDITRQAVTKHLRALERVGLVENERSGRESRFAFNPEPLEEARAYLDEVGRQWEGALGRLKAFVEKT